MSGDRHRLSDIQRDAIWKWRWLGLRNSTPGFKVSLILLALAATWIAVRAFTLQ